MLYTTTKTQQKVFSNNIRRLALIVSNDINTSHVLTSYLKHKNFQVYSFRNTIDAFEHFQKRAKDYRIIIIISGIRFSEINRFEFVRRIRKLNDDIMVILTSKFEVNMSEFSKLLPSTKIDGIICKPDGQMGLEEIGNLVEEKIGN